MTRLWQLLPIVPTWWLPYIVFYHCYSPHVYMSNDELFLYPQEDCHRYDAFSVVLCTLGVQFSITSQQYLLFIFWTTIHNYNSNLWPFFSFIMHVLYLYFHNLNGIHSPRPDPIPFPPGFPQTALSTSDSHLSLSSVNSSSHTYHLSPLLRHLYHLCLLFFLNSSLWVCVDSSVSLWAPEGQRPILLIPPHPRLCAKKIFFKNANKLSC